jgi:hypothetical protein
MLCANLLCYPAFADEYEVKAALIYKITKFVSWPDHALSEGQATFNICILGNDPFSGSLETIKSRKTQGRLVSIERYNLSSEIKNCQIVYINETKRGFLKTILKDVHNASVLSISDMKNFAKEGGIIEISYQNNALKFIININSAQQARIKIAAPLLELSEIIQQEDR